MSIIFPACARLFNLEAVSKPFVESNGGIRAPLNRPLQAGKYVKAKGVKVPIKTLNHFRNLPRSYIKTL
jgi:hypothetical protein